MPVVDSLAGEYADSVQFIAIGGRSSASKTEERAPSLLSSGAVPWGYDDGDSIFSTYGIIGQPWTVLISASGVEVERWAGNRGEDAIRASIQSLIDA